MERAAHIVRRGGIAVHLDQRQDEVVGLVKAGQDFVLGYRYGVGVYVLADITDGNSVMGQNTPDRCPTS